MSTNTRLRAYLYASVAPIMFGAIALASTSANATCTGPGAPTNTQTKCLTAVTIGGAGFSGNPLNSFDISWVNPNRAEYYLADRSNSSIDIIDTQHLKLKRQLVGFAGFSGNNNTSGPDGVVTHGRWLYAGDAGNKLQIFDLLSASNTSVATVLTGSTPNRVDEMALTTDGKLLAAVNNADSPPFVTLFHANGDAPTNSVSKIAKITVDSSLINDPAQSIEQPTWDPNTKRFYVSIPQIQNNPAGCSLGGPNFCEGGMLVIDPSTITGDTSLGLYNQGVLAGTDTGVVPLHACAPNGITLGPHNTLLEACTPANAGDNVTSLVINAKSLGSANINGITGSDEVWFNKGDNRYYLGASKDCTTPGGPCPSGGTQTAHLGVVDATSVLIEKIPSASNAHSVAADSKRNLIFVPENASDTKGVAAGVCGGSNGCVAVYSHDVHDHDGDNDDHDDH